MRTTVFAFLVFGLIAAGMSVGTIEAAPLVSTPESSMRAEEPQQSTPLFLRWGVHAHAFHLQTGVTIVTLLDGRGSAVGRVSGTKTLDDVISATYSGKAGEMNVTWNRSSATISIANWRGVGHASFDVQSWKWMLDDTMQKIIDVDGDTVSLIAAAMALAEAGGTLPNAESHQETSTFGKAEDCGLWTCKDFSSAWMRSLCCEESYDEINACCTNRVCMGCCALSACDAACLEGDFACFCHTQGDSCIRSAAGEAVTGGAEMQKD